MHGSIEPGNTTITIDTTDDDDSDDVVFLPAPAVPIYAIDDTDEEEASKAVITKPAEAAVPQTNNTAEKFAIECKTEPTIVAACAQHTQRAAHAEAETNGLDEKEAIIKIAHDSAADSSSDVCILEDNKHIGHAQFRALHIYEPETQTEQTASTGTGAKDTVIRTISSSEDETRASSLTLANGRTKRLQHHRAAGVDGEEGSSSADEGVAVKKKPLNKLRHIKPGQAIERYVTATRRKIPFNKRHAKLAPTLATAHHGQLPNADTGTDSELSDGEDPITAREIAERVLARKQQALAQRAKPQKT